MKNRLKFILKDIMVDTEQVGLWNNRVMLSDLVEQNEVEFIIHFTEQNKILELDNNDLLQISWNIDSYARKKAYSINKKESSRLINKTNRKSDVAILLTDTNSALKDIKNAVESLDKNIMYSKYSSKSSIAKLNRINESLAKLKNRISKLEEAVDEKLMEIEDYHKFSNSPQNYLPIDLCGDQYLHTFIENYWGQRLSKVIPIFNDMYDYLIAKGFTSEDNMFECKGSDRKLYALSANDAKAIIMDYQGEKFILISEYDKFHVRQLYSKNVYPESRKDELKGCAVEDFKGYGFKPKYENKWFDGTVNDEGYVLTGSNITPSSIKIHPTGYYMIQWIIGYIGYWINDLTHTEDYDKQ